MPDNKSPWIVVKLGGTSVSRPDYWDNLIGFVREWRRAGQRVLVVQSALSGITDALEGLLKEPSAAVRRAQLATIEARHAALAREMGVSADDALAPLFAALAADAAQVGDDPPPALHARILAAGELLASCLGAAYLRRQGVAVKVCDARTLLHAAPLPGQSLRGRYLSAVCTAQPAGALAEQLGADTEVALTQGFIAADAGGDTVVLGRGGSDTSAAYFAAALAAERLEIWTDVPGLFSADPREVPDARLLRAVDYDEAQEICSSGAKVLHPRCVEPARAAGIPIRIRCTAEPSLPGTLIGPQAGAGRGRVKAVSMRRGIKLVSMETAGMWQQIGFLADAFGCFKQRGLSVDLVATSETTVTASLDVQANVVTDATLRELLRDLNAFCRAHLLEDCAAVTLVGREMRANLHLLAPALELFQQRRVHLLSQAANDLNFTFVVDQADAPRLVRELHALLLQHVEGDPLLGSTWTEINVPATPVSAPWWVVRRDALLEIAAEATPRYVYDLPTIAAAAERLQNVRGLDRLFYSVKANHHPDVLRTLEQRGLGFECVSPGEIAHLRALFPQLPAERLLFTPNFAPRDDYAAGLAAGAWVTLDSLYPLAAWPELFADRDLFLRMDPGHGAGHHRHVRTAGESAKFGIPVAEVGEARRLADAAGARVVGLHAHAGSGILDAGNWRSVGLLLAETAAAFPAVRFLDIGGGLGIPERPGQPPLDLAALEAAVQAVKAARPACEVWLEPGRYLVAAAGVLLARVTQIKGKGASQYVGVDAGMNSLIRPALYGAWHPIVNLTRLNDAPDTIADVVGPICESGDFLGRGRPLPLSREGDILLIANTGAYGRVMSSNYNLREPAAETTIAGS